MKLAAGAAVEAVGGVTAASVLLGVGISTVSKAVSRADEWRQSHLRLDLAVRLDRAAGHPFIHTAMGRLLSAGSTASGVDLSDRFLLRLDRILDDVVREVADAMDDGRLDAAERQAVQARIVAAHQTLSQLSLFVAGI